MKLSKEQILQIPKMLSGDNPMNHDQIAEHFNVHAQTIVYWVARLRKDGHKLPHKRGRRPLNLK